MANRLVLGLVGNPGSGKSTLADYLAEKHGFYHFEGSDGIRELAAEHNVTLKSRKDYSDFHRKMQQQYGPDILAKRLLARPEDRVIFAGLRSVHNARLLQRAGGLIVVLEAPVAIRFKRAKKVGLKHEDNLKDFEAAEKAEFLSPDGFGSDPGHVMELADIRLDTSKPFAQTLRELDKLVKKLEAA